jgi:hypothetical protein
VAVGAHQIALSQFGQADDLRESAESSIPRKVSALSVVEVEDLQTGEVVERAVCTLTASEENHL